MELSPVMPLMSLIPSMQLMPVVISNLIACNAISSTVAVVWLKKDILMPRQSGPGFSDHQNFLT